MMHSRLDHVRHIEVSWGDCDAAAIVFYARYYAWFDAGTHAMLESVGLDHRTLQQVFAVVGLPLVGASATFHAPATYGDRLQAHTSVSELGRSRVVVEHVLQRGTTVVARGTETRVWASRHPEDPSRLSTTSIPLEVRELLQGRKRAIA